MVDDGITPKTGGASPPHLLDDPANFLHSIDIEQDQAVFFRTSTDLLRSASFADGRNAIALSQLQRTSLSAMVAPEARTLVADRFLFNCSFCGSTLLARLLDVPGRSLVIKEPRCLTDLAAWKIFNLRDGKPLDRLRPSLEMARVALRRRFRPGEKVTVKVASQGNILLETLAEEPARLRPVFITISRASFLSAVFRGGADRMQYAAKIAWHMATGVPDGDALLKEAVKAGSDPLRKAANLAILARYLQVGTFQRAALLGGWNDDHVIDFDAITQTPHEAATKAASALDLDIDARDIERNVERFADRYAKQPGLSYSTERQISADRAIFTEHRQVFDEALSWAESTLGPERMVAA